MQWAGHRVWQPEPTQVVPPVPGNSSILLFDGGGSSLPSAPITIVSGVGSGGGTGVVLHGGTKHGGGTGHGGTKHGGGGGVGHGGTKHGGGGGTKHSGGHVPFVP